MPEIELVSYDMAFANVKRPLLFREGGTMGTTTDGQVTSSAARAKRIIIFESVPLSNSDEDAGVVLVWWLMEFPSHQLPLQKCLLTFLPLFLRLLQ